MRSLLKPRKSLGRVLWGLCGFIGFLGVLLLTPISQAQNLRAFITADEAFVYEKPDFDSQIIGAAIKGEVYSVSRGKRGAFHKIRLKPGVLGWVSEVDFKVVSEAQAKQLQQRKKQVATSSKKKSKGESSSGAKIKRNKPINECAYWGPTVHWASFTENTMGAKRSDALFFLGARLSGPGTLFWDETFTDASLALAWGAPKYYQKVTGRSADGWILLADYLYIMDFPQSRRLMSFIGFGPMFRYSHFNVSLPQEGVSRDLSYSLDDMALGAVFAGGFAYQMGNNALRIDAKYHWEKQAYFGAGVSFQFLY